MKSMSGWTVKTHQLKKAPMLGLFGEENKMETCIQYLATNQKWAVIDHHHGRAVSTILDEFDSEAEAYEYLVRIIKEARAGRKKGD